MPVEVTDIEGNIATTPTSTIAYWLLPDADWYGWTTQQRAAWTGNWTSRLAELAGRRIWLYGDHHMYPSGEYVARMRDRAPAPSPAYHDDVDRAAQFADLLDPGAPGALPGASKPVTILGVRIAAYGTDREHLKWIVCDEHAPDRLGNVEATRIEYARVAEIVHRLHSGREPSQRDPVLDYPQPLTEDQLWWLIQSRRAAGHHIDPSGLVDVSATRGEPGLVPIVAQDRDGWPSTRYVHTMRVAQWRDRDEDETRWLPAILDCDARPALTAQFDLVPSSPEAVEKAETRVIQLERNYADMQAFRVRIDDATESATETAGTITDRLASPDETVSVMACGVVLVHVSGDSPEACRAAARQVRAELATGGARDQNRGAGLVLTAPPAQFAEYWSGIPGHDLGQSGPGTLPKGYLTRQPLEALAACGAGASLHAGDSLGMLIGNTIGSLDLYAFDVLGGAAANRSNLIGVAGAPGSGKSSLIARVATFAAESGVPTTLTDPSGMLSRLAQVPGLADMTRVLPVGRRTPGALASHYLILDPVRDAYDTDEEWREAMDDVAAVRMRAAFDTVRMVPTMLSEQDAPAAHEAAQAAIGRVGGAYGTDPAVIIDAIAEESPAGERFARALRAYAAMPDGRVFFDRPSETMTQSRLLTIITIEGYEPPPPPGTPRSEWTTGQLQSRAVNQAVTLLAGRHVWSTADPKVIGMDEQTQQVGAGGDAYARFVTRLAVDSRKVGAAVLLGMHTPETITRIDPGLMSMFGAHIQMGIPAESAAGFLPALRLPAGHGWEHLIESLPTGHALIRGWDDKVRRVSVDRSWWSDDLIAATDTTPVQRPDPIRTVLGTW